MRSVYFAIFLWIISYVPLDLAAITLMPSQDKQSEGTQTAIVRYDKQELDSVHVGGTLILNGTRIKGVTEVNGRLQAACADLDRLEVTGQANLKNTLVRTGAIIDGALVCDKCHIYKQLSIASQKIVISGSVIESIKIRKIPGYKGPQVLELHQGSKVEGSVVFESGNGEIIISSDSQIEGAITGPKVPKMKVI